METAERVTTGKRGHKILIQIGLIIIILFTIVTLAVSNMVTMASFSTALSGYMYMFADYMENLADGVKEYESLTWLMDYWLDNSDELIKDGIGTVTPDPIDDILEDFSKSSAKEVTGEESASLSPEDQKRFALWCYDDLQNLFRIYQSDGMDFMIFLALTDDDSGESVVCL